MQHLKPKYTKFEGHNQGEDDFLTIIANVGGMACKGLRAISYQGTREFKAGYKPSHTIETLMGYCMIVAVYFLISKIST